MPITPLEPWTAAKIGREGRPVDLDALESYQLSRLNETLSRVQDRSRFYRRRLGVEEIRLLALEDLADLPFTTAEDLKAAPLDFLCVGQHEIERIVTLPTSGTTGPPKRVFFSAQDQELTRDFFHRGMSTLVEAGDRVLIMLPGDLPGSVGDLLRDGLRRMEVEGIPHGPVADLQNTLQVIKKKRVTALVGIPVQVLQVARLAAVDRRHSYAGLKSVLLSTDRVPRAVVSAIEEVWGCDVYNHYGSTEMGLGGGVDCRARAGYHMREADLFFEIVDPVTGQVLPDGERGEVVFTTLTRAAMPLIRYRTGDVSCFIPEPCPCRTVLKRMAHVDDRLAGGITLPGGEIIHQSDLDEALFPIDGLADFRAVFAPREGLTNLVLHIRRCGGAFQPDEDEILRSLRDIPALSTQMAQERLSIDVRDWGDADYSASGTKKREIAHLHEGSA